MNSTEAAEFARVAIDNVARGAFCFLQSVGVITVLPTITETVTEMAMVAKTNHADQGSSSTGGVIFTALPIPVTTPSHPIDPPRLENDPVEFLMSYVGFGMVLAPILVAAMFMFFSLMRPSIRNRQARRERHREGHRETSHHHAREAHHDREGIVSGQCTCPCASSGTSAPA